ERLAAAGDGFGLRHAGSLAAEGLAVEAGVPRFGTEMSPNIPAAAASIDRLLDVERNRGFIGRAAVLAARAKVPRKSLLAFTLEGTGPGQFANAPILGAKGLAGYVSSAADHPQLGAAVLRAPGDRRAI